MNTQDTLASRYQILSQIGQGGNGITYQGKDLNTGETVALKVLSLGDLEHWSQFDYFEREIKVLQQLDHPKIPKYIDCFISHSSDNTYYYLSSSDDLKRLIEQGTEPDKIYIVQEFIQGQSLDQLIQNGWQPDEKEVKAIAGQILKILVYLQELIPPIVHRDIKPHNLIYTENREIFLVDFGGVQDRIRQTTCGSSVVGTYGYMSPEQFRGGKTYPCTDLYGLGATLIHLLSGKHPSDLPQKRLKIDFADAVKISPQFKEWIDKLIEPDYRNRIPSAQVALDILEDRKTLNEQVTFYLAPPQNSSLKLIKTDDQLTLTIPAAFNRKQYNYRLAWMGISFYAIIALMWFMFYLSISWFYIGIIALIYVLLILGEIFIFTPIGIKVSRGLRWLIVLSPSILSCMPRPASYFEPSTSTLNLPSFISFLVLMVELIYAGRLRNIIREFIGETTLKFNRNARVNITQKLGIFPRQKLSFLISKDGLSFLISKVRLNRQYMRLLTQEERLWLNQQIEQFLRLTDFKNLK